MAETKPKKPRVRKAPTYRHFRLSKPIKHPVKLLSAPKIFVNSCKTLKRHWRLFAGVLVVYGLLNILLVRGVGSGLNLANLKNSFQQVSHGHFGEFTTGLSLFSVLLSSTGSTSSDVANAYQSLLLILISLAVIWALRQVNSSKNAKKVRIRDSFYLGMYPLVPFILVLIVISLQLLPMLIGGSIYSLIINNGIAVTALEKIFWAFAFFLLVLLSLYMVTSSLFALYIVTLPDMTPIKALRSARQLVLHRRWTVLRKILFLPAALLLLSGLVMVPVVLLLTPLAEWLFFIFTVIGLAIIHSYVYTLYKELL